MSKDTKQKEKTKTQWKPIDEKTEPLVMTMIGNELVSEIQMTLRTQTGYRNDFTLLIEAVRNWLCVNYSNNLRIHPGGECVSDAVWLTIAHLLCVDEQQSQHVYEAEKAFTSALRFIDAKQKKEEREEKSCSMAELIEALEDRIKHLILTYNHSPPLIIKQETIQYKWKKLTEPPQVPSPPAASSSAGATEPKETETERIQKQKANAALISMGIPYIYPNQRPSSRAGDIVANWELEKLEYACAYIVVHHPHRAGVMFIPYCARYFTWTCFFRRLWVRYPIQPIPLEAESLGLTPASVSVKNPKSVYRLFLKWCLARTEIKADFDFQEPYLDFLYTSYLPLGCISNYFRLKGLELKSTRRHVIFRTDYEEFDRTGILADLMDEVLRNWMMQTVASFEAGVAPLALQHDLHCFFLFVDNFQVYVPGLSFLDEYVMIGEEVHEKREMFDRRTRFHAKNGEYRPKIVIWGQNEIRIKNGKQHMACQSRCHAVLLWLWLVHSQYGDLLEGGQHSVAALYGDIFGSSPPSLAATAASSSSSSSSSGDCGGGSGGGSAIDGHSAAFETSNK